MAEFTIPDKPCEWCSRFVGHFDWCPNGWLWCICQTSVVPSHKFGMHSRCLYVNDTADPDRAWRGIMWTDKQLQGVTSCHWPNPTDAKIVMRTAKCTHGTHPWNYVS